MFARDRPCSTSNTLGKSDDACNLALLSKYNLSPRNFVMQIIVVALHFV